MKQRFIKRAIAFAFVMILSFSTTMTTYAASPSLSETSINDVTPSSLDGTITYKDVFMETFYGHTNVVTVTPPAGSKLMAYVSWHGGATAITQIKKSTETDFVGVDAINSNNGYYTHNLTLVSNCDGSTYQIRFYSLSEVTISYLIEAEY